jgi:hypothetical protein
VDFFNNLLFNLRANTIGIIVELLIESKKLNVSIFDLYEISFPKNSLSNNIIFESSIFWYKKLVHILDAKGVQTKNMRKKIGTF